MKWVRSGECLERRCLLAGDRPFISTPLLDTFGHAETIAAVGDLDGDGRDDIVATAQVLSSTNPTQPAWYRYRAETNHWQIGGTFSPVQTDQAIRPVAIFDVDGDGDQDLLFEHHNSQVDYFMGLYWHENTDGQGTFNKVHDIPHEIDIYDHYRIADLDGDDDLDVGFTTGPAFMESSGWSENQSGKFQAHSVAGGWQTENHYYDVDNDGQRQINRTLPTTNGVDYADLDLDGDLDLIGRTGYWLENHDGQAHFTSRGSVGGGAAVSRALPQDIDRDGDIDLWVQVDSTLTWRENQGNWDFSEHTVANDLRGPIHFADVDGDGHDNLVTLDPRTNLFTRYDFTPATNALARHTSTMPGKERAEAVADINRDGRPDIVGILGWHEQTANPAVFITHRFPDELRPAFLDVADINQDGLLDLATATIAGNVATISWVAQTIDGFTRTENIGQIQLGSTYPDWFTEVRIVDFDSDGDLDLITRLYDSVRWWEDIDGHQTFVVRTLPGSYVMQIHDIDGDGDQDVLSGTNNGMAWFEKTETGWSDAHLIDAIEGEINRVGDLDGDGDADLVIANPYFWIAWHENLGNAFSTRRIIKSFTPDGFSRQRSFLELADFNGDADLDILYSTRPFELPFHYYADPDFEHQIFDNHDSSIDFVEVGPKLISRGNLDVIADLNGDGMNDLIESPRTVPGIIVSYNATPASPVGDVNQDGTLDVKDIDHFCFSYNSGLANGPLDLNRDGQVTLEDYRYLVEDILHYEYGDVDLDGDFDSSDLVQTATVGAYEQADVRAFWNGGDWNCDGRFNSEDLIMAMQTTGYEIRVANSVPLTTNLAGDRMLRWNELDTARDKI